jgi:hypothetical protein
MNKLILSALLIISQNCFSKALAFEDQTIFQKIENLYASAGTIDLNSSMVMAGRCYLVVNPNNPYPSYFIARQYSVDNGPIVPPNYKYFGGSQYHRTERSDYYDNQLRENEYQINMPFELGQDGAYSVYYQDGAQTKYKQSNSYIVALTYFNGASYPQMACYYFKRLR